MKPIKQISDPNFPTREEILTAMNVKLGANREVFAPLVRTMAEAVELMLLRKWRNDKHQREL